MGILRRREVGKRTAAYAVLPELKRRWGPFTYATGKKRGIPISGGLLHCQTLNSGHICKI